MSDTFMEIGGKSTRVVVTENASLFNADYADVIAGGQFDAIITDPPYSKKTHHQYDQVTRADGVSNSCFSYQFIDEDDIEKMSSAYRLACSGWVVWFTDSMLAHHICRAMDGGGRYAFAPLPYVHTGRSVRLGGDGPSSWTDWIVVSRTTKLSKWGTLRGAYISETGNKAWADKAIHGGKPTALMDMIVSDYTKPGDLVFDGHMGAGTTGLSCIKLGRRFVGCEIDPATFELAASRIVAADSQIKLF